MSHFADLVEVYAINAKTAIISQLQYRMSNLLFFLGMLAEPVVYLVVWQTVAAAQGGVVGGYTAAGFAGYYMIWTIVRYFNMSLTPFVWEWRIREGQMSGLLLRPVHPIHFDLGYFLGLKIPWTLYWLPIGAILFWVFKPDLNPAPWQIAALVVALFTGFVMRFVILWAMGLITFWIERVTAIFNTVFALELLFSGRLVPMSLLPEWAIEVSRWLPFQWAFAFPIELGMGRLTVEQALQGFGFQLAWFAFAVILIATMWHFAVRKYSAVGG